MDVSECLGCFILQYLLDRRLGEPQSQSGHGGEKKKYLPLSGIVPPDPLIVQLLM
jgi:hypothetical protein